MATEEEVIVTLALLERENVSMVSPHNIPHVRNGKEHAGVLAPIHSSKDPSKTVSSKPRLSRADLVSN